MPNIPLLALLLAFFLPITGFVGNYYVGQAKISEIEKKSDASESANKESRVALWNRINSVGERVTTHDAVIPAIEKRLDKMDDKLDKILTEVRK